MTSRRWRAIVQRWTRLSLKGDQNAARESIEALVPIRNEKLWFLIASAIIASVGLNTDSPAIVIGGMLISPLMGPIVGVGYALAVRDRIFARRALLHLGISIFVSLAVSAAYFAASPLHGQTHEILSRTKPNLLDLLVALAAATAGVIALAHAEISATLPGVAVATAIMPPLCVTGFGLANGDLTLGLGALYLFVVNAVAIALCAFVLFRRMHFSRVTVESGSRMSRWVAAGITAAFLLPLTYSLFDAARESRQKRIARTFVQEASRGHGVAAWNLSPGRQPVLTMFLLDQPSTIERARLSKALSERLAHAALRIHTTTLSPEVRQTIANLQASAIDSTTAIQRIEAALAESRREAEARAQASQRVGLQESWSSAAGDWKRLERRVESADLFPLPDENSPLLIVARLKRPASLAVRRRLAEKWEPWLASRLERPVRVLFEP